MVRNFTPSFATWAVARSTVLGMSCSLRSRKTCLPEAESRLANARPVAAVGELHADLIEVRGVADALDEALGLGGVGGVEGDDQPVARRKGGHATAFAATGAAEAAWGSSR